MDPKAALLTAFLLIASALPLCGQEQMESMERIVGEEFEYTLEGELWTLLDGDAFLPITMNRYFEPGQVRFSITFFETGLFVLLFARQDPASGAIQYHAVEVYAVTRPAEPAAAEEFSVTPENTVSVPDIEIGSEESQTAAGNPDSVEAAATDPQEPPAEEPVGDGEPAEETDPFLLALASEEPQQFENHIDAYLRENPAPPQDELDRLISKLLGGKSLGSDAPTADDIADPRNFARLVDYRCLLYPDLFDNAQLLFLVGSVLEEPSEYQDIAAAQQAYQLLTDRYPTDSLSTEARTRSDYILRHFFEIR